MSTFSDQAPYRQDLAIPIDRIEECRLFQLSVRIAISGDIRYIHPA